MQLRSGNTTLRRESRNYDEFRARTRYQQELERTANEDSIYDYENEESQCDDLSTKIKHVYRKTRHLLYLNEFQKNHNHSLIQKVETIKELYELYRNNIDYMIEFYNKPYNRYKRLPEVIVRKGKQVLQEICLNNRTRKEQKIYKESEDLILTVVYLIEKHILNK